MLSKGKRAAANQARPICWRPMPAAAMKRLPARCVGGSTVYRTKRRFVEGNLERALSEDPRPGAERKLTGKEEALLVATPAPALPRVAPAGRWSFWPGRCQAYHHESLSHETVRRRLADIELRYAFGTLRACLRRCARQTSSALPRRPDARTLLALLHETSAELARSKHDPKFEHRSAIWWQAYWMFSSSLNGPFGARLFEHHPH